MTQGCAKDKTSQLTQHKQIRQGWHILMRNSLLHFTFTASNEPIQLQHVTYKNTQKPKCCSFECYCHFSNHANSGFLLQ